MGTASATRSSGPAGPRATPSGPAPAPRIFGQLLVEERVASPAQVEAALEEQAASGERLGAALVRMGIVDAEVVARLLARQLGLEYLPPPVEPAPSLADLLPEEIARRARVAPLAAGPRRLRLAMEDPLDLATADDIRFRTGRRVEVVVVSPSTLAVTLDTLYGGEVARLAAGLASEPETDDRDALERAARAAPVVRLVDRVLSEAVDARASDVHLEPGPDGVAVRFRVDGLLQDAHQLPFGAHAALISRLKIMAGMDIAVRRRPQDGGLVIPGPGGDVPLRVSMLPSRDGEKAVIRILDPGRSPTGLDQLGLDPADRKRLRRLLAGGQGVILASGPTGSGKSSTLHAALLEVDRTHLNVVTLEDPVEYRLPGVTHVQVDARAGLGFADALRAVLRQDPDVIMVGEIRDRETAEIAMAAAVTGHLVLSTIHTTDAPGAVARLLQMGVPSYLVAGGLAGVVAQRLVRTVCGACRGRSGGGCPRCLDGFLGRTGVFQVLVMEDALRDAVVSGAPVSALRRRAREAGMGTLADDARRKVAEGVTTPHEAGRVLRSDPGAALPCGGCGEHVPSGAQACPGCGRPQALTCTCGARLEPGWRYCPWCVRKIPGWVHPT
jgi:type IV pilus assembly protein PilB